MKSKSVFFGLVIILLFTFTQSAFSWGKKGHKLINKMSVYYFPPAMKPFMKWQSYLEKHASDADLRKKIDPSERPKHYIDIDYYKSFLEGKMIENENSLISKYGKDVVIKEGILPWATLNTFKNLTKAFKNKNKEKALFYAADLGHYVADAHQPMHTVMNYNGQLTGQKGIHARYEITMVNEHLKDLKKAFKFRSAPYIKNPLKFIFNYISNSNSVCDVLFDADKLAEKEAGSTENQDYYRILWFRTKYITKIQFNHAAEDIASLIYTAWVQGGKPSFDQMK
ncbi:MAG TPA: hypothetical protein ENI76_00490 [Ignavibacteria bacterium]|nr:hypothetical protein [Ignavibacteria bacterium]